MTTSNYVEYITSARFLMHKKAPRGKTYLVHSVTFVELTTCNGVIAVWARYIERFNANQYQAGSNDILGVISPDHRNFAQFPYPIPIQTKYLSIMTSNTTFNGAVMCIINYELVKATRRENIYDFVSKRS